MTPTALGKPPSAPSTKATSWRAKSTMPGANWRAGSTRTTTTATGCPSTTFPAPAIEISHCSDRPSASRRKSSPSRRPRNSPPGPTGVDLRPRPEHGRPRAPASAGPAGTTISLRFAEVLNPDGTLYTDNLRDGSAPPTTTPPRAIGEGETWEPRFTFHGFRYVELDGLPGDPLPDAITGVVLHSDTPAHRRLHLHRSADQPAPAQHRLGPARQFPRRAHRLPAAQRAPRLDGRRAGLQPHRRVEPRTSPASSTSGCATSPTPSIRDGAIPASPPPTSTATTPAYGGPAGARRRHLPLDDVPVLRRPGPARPALRRHEPFIDLHDRKAQRPHPLPIRNTDWEASATGSPSTADAQRRCCTPDLIATAFFVYAPADGRDGAPAMGRTADATPPPPPLRRGGRRLAFQEAPFDADGRVADQRHPGRATRCAQLAASDAPPPCWQRAAELVADIEQRNAGTSPPASSAPPTCPGAVPARARRRRLAPAHRRDHALLAVRRRRTAPPPCGSAGTPGPRRPGRSRTAEHELLQPLRLRRGRRVDVPHHWSASTSTTLHRATSMRSSRRWWAAGSRSARLSCRRRMACSAPIGGSGTER